MEATCGMGNETEFSRRGAERDRFVLLRRADGSAVLVDCGMYQERDFEARNWDPFPVPPASIDAVLLTHAHLDHCGLLPKLVKEGFEGNDLLQRRPRPTSPRIVLLDSAKIQEEDVEYKKRRHEREGRKGPYPAEPLYTIEDAEACHPPVQAACSTAKRRACRRHRAPSFTTPATSWARP